MIRKTILSIFTFLLAFQVTKAQQFENISFDKVTETYIVADFLNTVIVGTDVGIYIKEVDTFTLMSGSPIGEIKFLVTDDSLAFALSEKTVYQYNFSNKTWQKLFDSNQPFDIYKLVESEKYFYFYGNPIGLIIYNKKNQHFSAEMVDIGINPTVVNERFYTTKGAKLIETRADGVKKELISLSSNGFLENIDNKLIYTTLSSKTKALYEFNFLTKKMDSIGTLPQAYIRRISKKDSIWYVVTGQNLALFSKNLQDWKTVDFHDTIPVYRHVFHTQTKNLWCTSYNNLYESYDMGKTWKFYSKQLPKTEIKFYSLEPDIQIFNNEYYWFQVEWMKYNKDTKKWQTPPYPFNKVNSNRKIFQDKVNGNLYTFDYVDSTIYEISDFNHWKKVGVYKNIETNKILNFEAHDNKLYSLLLDGIYKSLDFGKSWSKIASFSPIPLSIFSYHDFEDKGYIVIENNCYLFDYKIEKLQLLQSHIPTKIINDILFDKENNRLWVSTYGGLFICDPLMKVIYRETSNSVHGHLTIVGENIYFESFDANDASCYFSLWNRKDYTPTTGFIKHPLGSSDDSGHIVPYNDEYFLFFIKNKLYRSKWNQKVMASEEKAMPITNKISVSPNPASDKVYVKYQTNSIENLTYSLLDLQGRILFQNTSNEAFFDIDIQGVPNGFYILNVKEGNMNYNTKIIVNK